MKMLAGILFAALALAHGAFAQEPIKVTTTIHPDGTRTDIKTDPDNHTQEASTYAGKKLQQRVVYKLDDQELAISAEIFNGKGMMLYKAEYKRDFQGLVAEERDFTPSGEFIRRMVFTYDTAGHTTRIDTYDVNGRLVDQVGKGIKRKPERR